MYLATEVRPAAVITEGAFTSLPDVGAILYPWVPVRFIMRNRFDNLQRARAVAIPWLVFHGQNDTEIPFTHARLLNAAAASSLLIPLSGGHNDGVTSDRAITLTALRTLADRLFLRG